MKHLRYYIQLLLLSVLTLTGCEKSPFINNEESGEIIIPTNGYIHFSPGKPSTRATLVNDMKRNFGVMGYRWEYTNSNDVWNTVKVQAKPNVFYNQLVTYDDDANLHTYDAYPSDADQALVPWATGSKYTFFGYYPHTEESNGSIVLSGENVEGTPYLTYTLPTSPANMLDVMTAALYNTDYKSSREVNLNFKHRLAAVDLQMVNMNAPLENGTEVYVQISNLKINFDNLKYNKANIYMDSDMALERTEASNKKPSYTLSANAISVPPSTASSIHIIPSGNPLIIIPQEKDSDYLKGTITFTLNYSNSNGDNLNNNKELKNAKVQPGAHTHTFNIGRDVLAGRKHIIQLTFTRDAVTVQSIPPGEWEDKIIDTEFE